MLLHAILWPTMGHEASSSTWTQMLYNDMLLNLSFTMLVFPAHANSETGENSRRIRNQPHLAKCLNNYSNAMFHKQIIYRIKHEQKYPAIF